MRRAMTSSYADPNHDRQSERRSRGGHIGGGVAYCVRLCDGRHFPISNRGGNAAEVCKSFCPASPTKVFSGGGIENAYSSDGKRYSDIPNAFVYRAKLVPDCTCDGKSAFGLASVPIEDDATLRSGDIVATNTGLTVYNGRDPHEKSAFTPIASANLSKSLRSQLADVKVTPRPASADAAPVSTPQNQASTIAGELRLLSARAQ